MKTVNNSLAFCNSNVAQFRFRCLQILERQGYAGVKLAFPSVGRRTVFRWQEKYLKSGRKLTSLIPKSTKPKLRVFRCPKQADISLGYLQVDGVRVVWEGQSLYFLCAVELKSRQAFVERVSSLSSLKAKQFLERILREVSYQIHTIQTDNGSEFAKYFDEALEELSITHKWSLPHSPKVNGYIERFNGVIQAEFIDYHVDLGVIDKPLFDQKLSEWMIWYNTRRPHHSLGLKTPQQRLLQLQQHITNPQSAICV